MPTAKRPYVICHMGPSVDGRIVTANWKVSPTLYREYERTAERFDANAWMIGRVSMEPYAGTATIPRRGARGVSRADFVARRDARSYAIALDPSGKLTWSTSSIDGEHVISVLTQRVPDNYLAFLQDSGVSYIFGGKRELDLKRVLQKLRRTFGIKRLLLEGGGTINGSFLAANLIDELSLLVAPIADGGVGTPSLFDAAHGHGPARVLKLISVKRLRGDIVWLRYGVRH